MVHRPGGLDVGRTLQQVDRCLAHRRAEPNDVGTRPGGRPSRQRRYEAAGAQEQYRDDQRGRRMEHRKHRHHEDAADERHHHWHAEPQEGVLQGVDIAKQARCEVGTAPVLKLARRQRLEAPEQEKPQPGENAEHRLVADETLQISPARAQDGAETDRGRRKEIVHHAGGRSGDRHCGDEPAGHRHQRE